MHTLKPEGKEISSLHINLILNLDGQTDDHSLTHTAWT